MSICTICPNNCAVDRDKFSGACGVKNDVVIAKYYLHPYEEPCISGKNGSGCVFFAGCSLKCAFCQNYELSHEARGKIFSVLELAEIFKRLENMGAHNVNLVNPTHYTKQIIDALNIYRPNIPVVWNTHGYEKIETLEKINDYVDVYLTDLKYFKPSRSKRYCKKEDYFEVASKAVKFMCDNKEFKFCGDLMVKGVVVRHLVLPQNVDESLKILEFLKGIIGEHYLSVMAQYTPFGKLDNLPELTRKITRREYDLVVDKLEELNFERVYLQEMQSSGTNFIPDWDF